MYDYETEKSELFTDQGQRLFLGIRDNCHKMLARSGAFTMGKALNLPDGIGAASSWQMMACVDRMVELGEVREIATGNVLGQSRIFVAN